MQLFQLLGAAGVGSIITTIITKWLDILLQKKLQKYDHIKWLREQRIKAYSQLIHNLLSIKLWDLSLRESEGLVDVSDSILLSNAELALKIENYYRETEKTLRKFIGKRQSAQDCGDDAMLQECNEEMNQEYLLYQEKTRSLINELRLDLLEAK
jgi:hypothetical protein